MTTRVSRRPAITPPSSIPTTCPVLAPLPPPPPLSPPLITTCGKLLLAVGVSVVGGSAVGGVSVVIAVAEVSIGMVEEVVGGST